MDIAEAREFMKGKQHGVLVARKRDGSLQMTLVSPAIVANGDLIITSRESTYKVKNIKRNPQVSLLVYGDKFHGSGYVQVDGRAEVIPQPAAMEMVFDWHRQIRGVPDNWDDLHKKYLAEGRIAMRIHIDRVGPQKRG